MKRLADWLVIGSILLVVYCIIYKIFGLYVLRVGPLGVKTISCVTVSIFLVQLALWIRLSGKK
jgi:hypothetical protein